MGRIDWKEREYVQRMFQYPSSSMRRTELSRLHEIAKYFADSPTQTTSSASAPLHKSENCAYRSLSMVAISLVNSEPCLTILRSSSNPFGPCKRN